MPRLDKLAGEFGTLGPMRLNHDTAPDELCRRLNMGHYLQPILTSETEMGFACHILTIRDVRKKLDEVSLLTPDPGSALVYLLFD